MDALLRGIRHARVSLISLVDGHPYMLHSKDNANEQTCLWKINRNQNFSINIFYCVNLGTTSNAVFAKFYTGILILLDT